eukprot:365319-Chlamydomonas_euryale.AAC.5
MARKSQSFVGLWCYVGRLPVTRPVHRCDVHVHGVKRVHTRKFHANPAKLFCQFYWIGLHDVLETDLLGALTACVAALRVGLAGRRLFSSRHVCLRCASATQ